MIQFLVFGAGKSSTALIQYLCTYVIKHESKLIVADQQLQLVESKIIAHEQIQGIALDLYDDELRRKYISCSDIVISLMPPHLHYVIAKDCLTYKKHLLTASYVDEKIKALDEEVKSKHLLFLCEMGLDPGIDHMSAMQMIDYIKKNGGTITGFYSHCGGLIAPESDDNPWHYKISWNPLNIVNAGKQGGKFLLDHVITEIPYQQIFEHTHTINIHTLNANYTAYVNRDALPYIKLYQLENCKTFVRTTLRHPQFCYLWNQLVKLGFTDEHIFIDTNLSSIKDFTHQSLISNMHQLDRTSFEAFEYLGLFEDVKLDIGKLPIVKLLQQLLEQKLALSPSDKDMVVMKHEIEYLLDQTAFKQKAEMVIKGVDAVKTAMAKTVGLPLAIAAVLLAENKIQLKGVRIPTHPSIYEPVLKALETEGITFHHFSS